MTAVSSQGGLADTVDRTISSTTLASVAAYLVTFPVASQFGVIDSCHYFSLPANHGGLKMNWLVSSRIDGLGSNPFLLARIRQDWTWDQMDGDRCGRVPAVPVNDPTRTDAAVIIPPGAQAMNIRVRASAMFRSGAVINQTVNFQAALAGSGANVTVLQFSHLEFRLY